MLEAICKKGGAFKYPKAFQIDNGTEFKNEVTKLLEKHNVEIQRAATKYKKTHTAFVEAFNKAFNKLLFKQMDTQELQDPEKVSTIWVKVLQKVVSKMNNTGEQHGDQKIITLVNNMETKKDGQQTSFGAEICID